MGLVVHALQALHDCLLHLFDGLHGLPALGVDLEDALVVQLYLEALRPAAIAAQPTRLSANGITCGTLHPLIILAGVRRGAAFLLATAALAGCNSGSGDEAEPAGGAPKEVTETVLALQTATQQRDFRRICDDLFSGVAKQRAGGKDCAQLVRSTAGDVRRPKITPVSIRVRGDRADVRVRTTARGQRPIEDTIRLVRERDSWRIAALASN
jgi:hypothetical protein